MGHEVTVVTCVPHHPMGKVYPNYENKILQKERIDGINVVRLWTYVTANKGTVKRTVNYLFYMLMTVFAAPFLTKADIVLSTSPQFFNGLAGFFVSRIKKAPWVLEVRDLWPESILAVGAIKNRNIIHILTGLERFAYRKADCIVTVTDSFKYYIAQLGFPENKIEVVKNGVDLSQFHRVGNGESNVRDPQLRDKFVASYIGTIGMAHGLDTLLEAAKILKDETNIVFLIVGEGADRSRLEERVRIERISNVHMLGQLPKNEVRRVLAHSDVVLVLLRKLKLFKTVIPSKIFESMAMGVPIILAVEGESQKIVEDSYSGLVVEPENAKEIAFTVSCLSKNREKCNFLAENGPKFVADNFNRDDLARRYEEILRDLL